MSQFWNPRIKQLQPYVPGEQPQDRCYIKLNTNENPIPPSTTVREAMHTAVNEGLNLYPDPTCRALKQSIADYYALPFDHVFVGNGSDEVLAHTFAALFDPSKPLICPDISYSFYPTYARLYGLECQQIPLNERFEITLANYPDNNGGVIFANPNAPTSLALDLGEIQTFLQRNTTSTVVVDEAYIDFGGQSCLSLIEKYPNLLVVQTISKSRSLAGLRVGFALGSPSLIEGLNRMKDSFNSYPVDRVALAGAQAAFEDVESFEVARAQIIQLRDQTQDTLRELGFEVLTSSTNFLFARPHFMPAEALYQALKKAGILVRHFNTSRIDNFLRITIGTEPEMTALITQLRKILATSVGHS